MPAYGSIEAGVDILNTGETHRCPLCRKDIDEGARWLGKAARAGVGRWHEAARAVVDGETVVLAEATPLKKTFKHDISVVVDRLVNKPEIAGRLADSVETALKLAGGRLIVELVDTKELRIFSEKMSCPNEHTLSLTEIEPRTFSFNAPFGACPTCTGLGTKMAVDPDLVVLGIIRIELEAHHDGRDA